jgi:hypothetical protein
MAPPHNRNARRQPGVGGSGSANLTSWEQSDSELLPTAQGSLAPAAKRLLARPLTAAGKQRGEK